MLVKQLQCCYEVQGTLINSSFDFSGGDDDDDEDDDDDDDDDDDE